MEDRIRTGKEYPDRLVAHAGRHNLDRFEISSALIHDAVFVENVPRQRSDLAGQLGCVPSGVCVEVNEFGQTSVPDVSCTGDVVLGLGARRSLSWFG